MKNNILFFVLFVCASVYAQENITDKYIIQGRDKDALCFILPYKIPNITKNKKEILVDITYITSENEVTVNMTISSNKPLSVDSIAFISENRLTVTNIKTFYIDKDGQWWKHRYSYKLPFNFIKAMYLSNNPFQIIVFSEIDKFQFSYSTKDWHKEQTWMNEILLIITKNIQR